MEDKMDLSEIYAAYMADPDFDHLRKNYHFVPGVGKPDAEIMIVGEAPGEKEDLKREPFMGRSGEILDALLSGGDIQMRGVTKTIEGIGLDRNDIFITNILKYRPSKSNRDPSVAELQSSLPYLIEEIITIHPKLIISMGRVPTSVFFPGHMFKNLRGHVYKYKFSKLLVTYHPAAAMYNMQRILPELEKHFSLVMGALDDQFTGDAIPARTH